MEGEEHWDGCEVGRGWQRLWREEEEDGSISWALARHQHCVRCLSRITPFKLSVILYRGDSLCSSFSWAFFCLKIYFNTGIFNTSPPDPPKFYSPDETTTNSSLCPHPISISTETYLHVHTHVQLF